MLSTINRGYQRKIGLGIAAILLLAGLLGGCGQKGPLYMPDETQQK